MQWRPARVRAQGGEELMAGKVQIGSAFLDVMRPQGTPARYCVVTRLPGIKPAEQNRHKPTLEEAKRMVESIARTWFGWLDEEGSNGQV